MVEPLSLDVLTSLPGEVDRQGSLGHRIEYRAMEFSAQWLGGSTGSVGVIRMLTYRGDGY